MSNNMTIWDQVKKTDPKHTKKVTQRGGYTSISPQYQTQEATKIFGPYGMGWGFESIKLNMDHVEALGLCMVEAVFFYVIDDKRNSFPIHNAWSVKQGSKIDPDFAKKAETNTMSKALSKLGFSADVFMGQFDDHDYVQAVTNESNLANAEDKIEEAAKQEREHQEWVTTTIRVLETAVNMHELQTLFKSVVRKANLIQDTVSVAKFDNAKNKRKAELEQQEQS